MNHFSEEDIINSDEVTLFKRYTDAFANLKRMSAILEEFRAKLSIDQSKDNYKAYKKALDQTYVFSNFMLETQTDLEFFGEYCAAMATGTSLPKRR
jgi:hypothetical protein